MERRGRKITGFLWISTEMGSRVAKLSRFVWYQQPTLLHYLFSLFFSHKYLYFLLLTFSNQACYFSFNLYVNSLLPISVTLLLHCYVITLFLHCYYVITPLLHCCYTVVTLLLHIQCCRDGNILVSVLFFTMF